MYKCFKYLQKEFEIANFILEDIPKVKEVVKIEKQMKLEQMEVTKTKKKNRNERY